MVTTLEALVHEASFFGSHYKWPVSYLHPFAIPGLNLQPELVQVVAVRVVYVEDVDLDRAKYRSYAGI